MIIKMDQAIKNYLSAIGQKGGQKSKRVLTKTKAKEMVRLREAKKAYRLFYHQCFWSFDPHLKIKVNDVDWIVTQLKKCGNRETLLWVARLCR